MRNYVHRYRAMPVRRHVGPRLCTQRRSYSFDFRTFERHLPYWMRVSVEEHAPARPVQHETTTATATATIVYRIPLRISVTSTAYTGYEEEFSGRYA